jgi:hypothetical protein
MGLFMKPWPVLRLDCAMSPGAVLCLEQHRTSTSNQSFGANVMRSIDHASRIVIAGFLFAVLTFLPASAEVIPANWTAYTPSGATGTLDGVNVTATVVQGGPIVSIDAGFAPPVWQASDPLPSAAKGISLIPVNAGAEQIFTFSASMALLRFYVENFDSRSDAIVTASGATVIRLAAASPSVSWSLLSGSSGRLTTSNAGFDGEGDAILEMVGAIQSVRVQFLDGIQSNGIGYTFAVGSTSPVPEIDPAGMGSVLALVTGSLGLLERRRGRRA